MRYKFIATIAFSLFTSAISAQETQLGWYDSTGKFAGEYLCVATAAGGISFDDVSKTWRGTMFAIDKERLIVRVTLVGKMQKSPYPGAPNETAMGYKVEVAEPGNKSTVNCLDAEGSTVSISQNGYLSCSDFEEFKFNFENLRYMSIYSFGFINGENDNSDTPHITIGECSRF